MKDIKRQRSNFGFTLLELLVVISIIGLLATLLLANFNAARSRSRDAERRSDIKQYQTSLGEYASSHTGLYPSILADTNVCPGLQTALGLTVCFTDPMNDDDPTRFYRYRTTDGGGSWAAAATNYVIWADLENGGFWILCSNGQVGENTGQPAGGACPAAGWVD